MRTAAQKLQSFLGMEGLLRKLIRTVGGVILCIVVWTIQDRITGGDGGGSDSSDAIPQEVWGGGGGVVTIEVEASEPAVLSATFEDTEHDYLETWQKIEPGTHSFDIDVPAEVSGSIDLRVDEPNVGSQIKLTVLVDGRPVSQETARLDRPLEAGYGFSTGIALEDYAGGKLSED